MKTSEQVEMCSKHDMPYEEIGYDRVVVCIECHKENLEKYYNAYKRGQGKK